MTASRTRYRWVFPLVLGLALAGYIAWIALKGLSAGGGTYFRTELSPGVSGQILEPPTSVTARAGVVVLPGPAGWDEDQHRRATELARGGLVVVVLDYYRGGRDSYHGSPNESSRELEAHWQTNLEAGLRWLSEHRRGLSWTLLVDEGRPAALAKTITIAGFPVAEFPVDQPNGGNP